MREILFRGKRTYNREWEYGYYCRFGWVGKEKHYIIPEYASNCTPIEVIPETVGQYTGLKDKNGKKIFERDIVQKYWSDNSPCEKYYITYDTEIASFIGKSIDGLGFCTFAGDSELWKTIENIHDNPELLE